MVNFHTAVLQGFPALRTTTWYIGVACEAFKRKPLEHELFGRELSVESVPVPTKR